MCLIVFAWQSHPEYRLILAANRDERHARPAQALHWWPDQPEILAGRDLQAGGTWLAMTRRGRFATVTNYREQQRSLPRLASRGELVTGFVAADDGPAQFFGALDGEKYAGFSLLAGDESGLWCASNRGDGPDRLQPGVYGLSNAALDTPWPKLVRARTALRSAIKASPTINPAKLAGILADRTPAPADQVDAGDLPFEFAQALSAPFIVSAEYGTRCTTVLTWSYAGQVHISETRFDASGVQRGQSSFRFQVEGN